MKETPPPICTITGQLFFNPVSLSCCNQIIEEEAAKKMGTCPFCSEEAIEYCTDDISQKVVDTVQNYLTNNPTEYKNLYFSTEIFSNELKKEEDEQPARLSMLEKYIEADDISGYTAYSIVTELETYQKTLSKQAEKKLAVWGKFFDGKVSLDYETETKETIFSVLAETAEGCTLLSSLYSSNKELFDNKTKTYNEIIFNENSPLNTFPTFYKLLRFPEGHELFENLCEDKKIIPTEDFNIFLWMTGKEERHSLILDLYQKELLPISSEFLKNGRILKNLMSSSESSPPGLQILESLLKNIESFTQDELLLTAEQGNVSSVPLFCLLTLTTGGRNFLAKHAPELIEEILKTKLDSAPYKNWTLFQWMIDNNTFAQTDDDETDDDENEDDIFLNVLINLIKNSAELFEILKSHFEEGIYAGEPTYALLIKNDTNANFLNALILNNLIPFKLDDEIIVKTPFEHDEKTILQDKKTPVFELLSESPTRCELLIKIYSRYPPQSSQAIIDFLQNPPQENPSKGLPGYCRFIYPEKGIPFLLSLIQNKKLSINLSQLTSNSNGRKITIFESLSINYNGRELLTALYNQNPSIISQEIIDFLQNPLQENPQKGLLGYCRLIATEKGIQFLLSLIQNKKLSINLYQLISNNNGQKITAFEKLSKDHRGRTLLMAMYKQNPSIISQEIIDCLQNPLQENPQKGLPGYCRFIDAEAEIQFLLSLIKNNNGFEVFSRTQNGREFLTTMYKQNPSIISQAIINFLQNPLQEEPFKGLPGYCRFMDDEDLSFLKALLANKTLIFDEEICSQCSSSDLTFLGRLITEGAETHTWLLKLHQEKIFFISSEFLNNPVISDEFLKQDILPQFGKTYLYYLLLTHPGHTLVGEIRNNPNPFSPIRFFSQLEQVSTMFNTKEHKRKREDMTDTDPTPKKPNLKQ